MNRCVDAVVKERIRGKRDLVLLADRCRNCSDFVVRTEIRAERRGVDFGFV